MAADEEPENFVLGYNDELTTVNSGEDNYETCDNFKSEFSTEFSHTAENEAFSSGLAPGEDEDDAILGTVTIDDFLAPDNEDGAVNADEDAAGNADEDETQIPSDGNFPEFSTFQNQGPPDTGEIAQIVLITTSLGSRRRHFFNSIKARQFLDCKGVPYYLIDANRDVSQGANLDDQELLKDWSSRNLLARDESDENSKFAIPQVLIDGISIGDALALQDLEEDGDFDWIVVRAACPSCLNERTPTDAICSHCNSEFIQIIPEGLLEERRVQRYAQGQLLLDDTSTSSSRPPIKYQTLLQAAGEGGANPVETLTYENLFGEPAPNEDI